MRGIGSKEWLEPALLALLARRDAFGLEIADALAVARKAEHEGRPGRVGRGDAGAGEFLEGSVYAALRRLEHRGLLAARWVDVGAGTPRRRYYTLTAKGRRIAEGQAIRAVRGAPTTLQLSTAARR